MTPELIQIIGTSGALLILIGFIFNQLHKWKPGELKYDGVNMIGSGLLIWYAYLLHSNPFIVLNSVWLVVSLREVIRDLRKK